VGPGRGSGQRRPSNGGCAECRRAGPADLPGAPNCRGRGRRERSPHPAGDGSSARSLLVAVRSGAHRSMKIQGALSGVVSHVTPVAGRATSGEGARAADCRAALGGARTIGALPAVVNGRVRAVDDRDPGRRSPAPGPPVQEMERASACRSWKIGDRRADFPPAAGGSCRLRKITGEPAGFPRTACSGPTVCRAAAVRGTRDVQGVTNRRGVRSFVAFRALLA